MTTITPILDAQTFASTLAALPPTTLLVLSFHTPWAPPCAQMATLLAALASTYPPHTPPRITFLSLDAEALPDISESYDVAAVPFLVLQRAGTVLESVSGCDAAKVRGAVERWVEKDAGAKTALPPPLAVTPRAEGANGAGANGANGPVEPPVRGEAAAAADTDALNARLADLVKAAPVMLFMKGTPSSPQCGFSRQLVGLLRERGVRYGFFNILADEDVRQGLKVWADWPTYPQLWVGGELVGGLDIVSLLRCGGWEGRVC
jgi:Grx4 family monothiol glutaredoxin